MLTITAMIGLVVGALELYESVAPSFMDNNTNVANLGDGGRIGVVQGNVIL